MRGRPRAAPASPIGDGVCKIDFYPPGVHNLVLGDDQSAAIRIIDTAPEVDAKRAIRYLRAAD